MCLSYYEQISTVLVISTAFLQAVLALILLKRRIHADYPFFVTYLISNVLIDAILAVCVRLFSAASMRYFWIYWALNAVTMVVGFGVLYEILKAGLRPFSGLVDLAKMLFRWATLFLLLVALLTAFATIGAAAVKYLAVVQLMERSLLLMQCGLLLLFLLFERRLALSWRSYPVIMALGMGTSAALDLTFSFLRVRAPESVQLIGLADNFSTLLIAAFWLICLSIREPAPKSVLESPNRLVFQRWNEVLTSHGYGIGSTSAAPMDSFLPGIERTVDKVLARKIAN